MNIKDKQKVEDYVRKNYKSFDIGILEITEISYGLRVFKEGCSVLYIPKHDLVNILY